MKRFTLIKGGGEAPAIPTLRNPLAGLAETTWAAFMRVRGQLDGIKAGWTPDTQPVERTLWLVWSKQLDEVIELFLVDHPELRPKAGGGER